MFNKLLIANRGEISCRIIKTAQKMGILTVAIYSDADENSLHVKLADEAVYIGSSPSKDSYLQGERIIQAALNVKANAIHPGYGFLSENSDFASLCLQNKITFIGPPPSAIQTMGSKSAAKRIMQQAQVPLIAGYHGSNQDPAHLKAHAEKIGYPVLLKAAAGGGGKGMRQVWSSAEFTDALTAAQREALTSFNDDVMLVEKYLTQPRHIEIQIFCDQHGNSVYLFERDCSIQRRHQKIIEEAPAIGISEELRKSMGKTALKAAKAIDYVGAGTVEFLLDADDQFYFMEMNTRLQVEHPITEMITGQDLVAWQLRVANNEVLPLTQNQLRIHGHAIEARIYAEDPSNDFLPETGSLSLLQPPLESKYVRLDTGVSQGDEVTVYYDPMIAKLIVWDENRDKALQRLTKALTEYHIQGVVTNTHFLHRLTSSQEFKSAEIDTNFIHRNETSLFPVITEKPPILPPLAALFLLLDTLQNQPIRQENQDRYSPWSQVTSWRNNAEHSKNLILIADQLTIEVQVQQIQQNMQQGYILTIAGNTYTCYGTLANRQLEATINGHKTTTTVASDNNQHVIFYGGHSLNFSEQPIDLGEVLPTSSNDNFVAPMNGTIVTLLVKPGEPVNQGQTLVVMEAMKMEHNIKAPQAGIVKAFYCSSGDLVDDGTQLLSFVATEN
ncbi:acetyl/propionyl/methylcrotonyl-CoA carboxylase subunit alpha [Paraglaciecola marina]|uniref:acetyl/propionyl/methylcrotonyl-CoA carboxylase subunit alpha n=1 Tax=Paraglaciecola marina TaxID=2500157 RepID=UPI00105FEB3E|nr:acetyl/propionyl/methylcrotonyl-CoA carboxylase subunit alpha [Paraglaciecola marina]